METISLALPLLYALTVLGICAYLLTRGVTHLFVILFGLAAILHALPSVGFVLLQRMAGGIGGHTSLIGILSLFGALGTIASIAAFVSLAAFLLRDAPSA